MLYVNLYKDNTKDLPHVQVLHLQRIFNVNE